MTRSRIDDMIKGQEGLTELNRQTLDCLQLEKLNALLRRKKSNCLRQLASLQSEWLALFLSIELP